MSNDTHFVWLDSLTRPVNNPINIFLINPNIVLHYVLFPKYLSISKISLVLKGLKSTEKNFTLPLIINCKIIVKSFEILPRHSV